MAKVVTIGGNNTLFVGEDKTVRLGNVIDETGALVDMTGWSVLFDVRTKDTAPDPAIISRNASIGGVFNSNPLTNAQKAVVQLTDTDMNLFKEKTYRYSFKRMDDGSETVLARGDFKPQKATAP